MLSALPARQRVQPWLAHRPVSPPLGPDVSGGVLLNRPFPPLFGRRWPWIGRLHPCPAGVLEGPPAPPNRVPPPGQQRDVVFPSVPPFCVVSLVDHQRGSNRRRRRLSCVSPYPPPLQRPRLPVIPREHHCQPDRRPGFRRHPAKRPPQRQADQRQWQQTAPLHMSQRPGRDATRRWLQQATRTALMPDTMHPPTHRDSPAPGASPMARVTELNPQAQTPGVSRLSRLSRLLSRNDFHVPLACPKDPLLACQAPPVMRRLSRLLLLQAHDFLLLVVLCFASLCMDVPCLPPHPTDNTPTDGSNT